MRKAKVRYITTMINIFGEKQEKHSPALSKFLKKNDLLNNEVPRMNRDYLKKRQLLRDFLQGTPFY